MGLLLGMIGAWMGSSGLFGFGAAMGWFIGSTLGSLLSLSDSHESTSTGRITDFRSYNSKYGIPLNRGYGTCRFAGNLIWRGPVIETADSTTKCVKSGGFFGIGGSRKCVTSTTYDYSQSGAIAFAEGPASLVKKIWADGDLIWEEGTEAQSIRRPRRYTGIFRVLNPYNAYNDTGTRVYLGTLDQRIDPLIAHWLAADKTESGQNEAYAFRSTVYIVVADVDLEQHGMRMPTYTAEISFPAEIDDRKLRHLETNTILPTQGSGIIGIVAGHPNLAAGNVGSGRRALWDIRTQELLFEASGGVGDFWDGWGFVLLSPQLFSWRQYYPFGNTSYSGPYDYLSGRQLYWRTRGFYDHVGQSGAIVYDPIRNAFWTLGFLSADMDYWPLYTDDPFSNVPSEGDTVVQNGPYAVIGPNGQRAFAAYYNDAYVGGAAIPGLLFRSGRQLPEDWWILSNNPSGLSGRGVNIHLSKIGDVLWTTTSSALNNSWFMISSMVDTNIVTRRNVQRAYQIKDYLGVNIQSLSASVYVADDDSMVFVVGNGFYKVFLSEVDDVNEEVRLPQPGTEGRHYAALNIFQNRPAFQRGTFEGGKIGFIGDGNFRYTILDCLTMTVDRYYDWATDSIFDTSIHIPHLNATYFRPNEIQFWGSAKDTTTLSYVVEDLMTKVDGDPLTSLVQSDLDVSELTDTVRGYNITRQQSIRSAIAQLMQGFFFDAVEGDGKIKFRKRGRATSFDIPEDDLSASEHGSSINRTINYERRSEMEMPRELSVRYPDVDNDYLQNTQRARRTQTKAESNIDLNLQIVFNKDEAAQVADILLYDAWQERNGNFKFFVSAKHIDLEPGDVGTLTMNDGKVHRIRIVDAKLGADNVSEFLAVEEFENSYVSTATGISDAVGDNLVRDVFVHPILLGVTSRFLQNSSDFNDVPAVVGGVTAIGSYFDGGRLFIKNSDGFDTLVGVRGAGNGATWGTVKDEIGHPNNFINTNVYDTETSIAVNILGGDFPVSGTDEEVLAGERLMLIDGEILGYKTVDSPKDTTVTGTDISFDAATDTINSTTTDFVAAGFTIGMQFSVPEGSPQSGNFYWEVQSITANTIAVTGNITVAQIAGTTVTLVKAGRTCIFTNLLRGLYGTQPFTYHRNGARVYFPEKLFGIQFSPPEIGEPIHYHAQGMFGGPRNSDTIFYKAANLLPWNPTNLGYSGGKITWDRMDRIYSDGIDPAVPTDLGESQELYVVRHVDYNTPGEEGKILSQIETNTNSTGAIAVPDLPILIDVHQKNDIGLSYPLRQVVSSTGNYSGGGAVTTADDLEARWNSTAANVYMTVVSGSGPFAGESALYVTTGGGLGGAEFPTGACKDIEVLACVIPNNNVRFTFGQQCGIYLRGTGSDGTGGTSWQNMNVDGAFISFGSPSASNFAVAISQKGQATNTGIIPVYDDQISYDWEYAGDNYGRKFWVRARFYGNRVQARVWEDSVATEPTSWQLDAYDDSFGPYFGSCGLFALSGPLFCTYFSWAHRGGTAS